eukprot:SAG31_NODE_282_length_18516_cov_9.338600_5_plen_111_part_00
MLDEEKDDATQNLQLTDFGLPLYYNLTAQVLLREAPDDVPENHRCRTLLRDLEDTRKSKIRRGTHMVMDEVTKNDDVHQVESSEGLRAYWYRLPRSQSAALFGCICRCLL